MERVVDTPGLCRTCRFWEPLDDSDAWGFCGRIPSRDEMNKLSPLAKNYLVLAHIPADTKMATRSNFGCVLHESKESGQ